MPINNRVVTLACSASGISKQLEYTHSASGNLNSLSVILTKYNTYTN
ncbi:MAG: hypothetical protein LBJ00_07505 [Planctomycetaceae bacterium]|nr:hypothetical protein [Planctomycetaceae bacterium]